MALLADQGYALQLFTDFSGLTHVAIGLGLLFGIEGPPNFNRPFSARNIQEFWRRWHMSLTTWLADYLFMPLRMTFRRFGTWGLSLSLMINMVAIGLWHGGRLTYLVFGVVHGLFLIGSALSLNARETFCSRHPALERVRGVTAPLVTFHMVVFGMVFFRAPSLDFALRNLHSILLPQGDAAGWATLGRDIWLPAALAGLAGLLLGTGLPAVPHLGARLAPHFTWRRRPWLVWSGYAMAALTTVLLACETGGQFMYARF
jgi:D-alanyl-lipoteichoic acid acyltransferase DltB (MBOAT superfamily)